MSFLLDTMVLSDASKDQPLAELNSWLEKQKAPKLFISAASLGEIAYGIERLAPGKRRFRLEEWRDDLVKEFSGRILPMDYAIARVWGRIRRDCEISRNTMPLVDALLAATADVHGLTLVTRNVRDFEAWGGPVFDPWSQASV